MNPEAKNHLNRHGITVLEVVMVAAVLFSAIAVAIGLFRAGSDSSEKLARTTQLENGWQRFMLSLRHDLRSAEKVEVADNHLRINYSQISDPEKGELVTHEVEHYLTAEGFFCRRRADGSEQHIPLTFRQNNLVASLSLSLSASDSVSVKLEIQDTITGNRLFTGIETVKIAAQ